MDAPGTALVRRAVGTRSARAVGTPPGRALGRALGAVVVLSTLLVAVLGATGAAAQEPAGPTVEILPVEGYLDPPVAAAIEDLLAGAEERDSALVVLQLSLGGVVSVDTARLAQRIDDSPVPVAVVVGPLSQGAELAGGALELMAAADVRAMAFDATLGPLVPLAVADPVDAEAADAALTRLRSRWPALADRLADAPARARVTGTDVTQRDDAGVVTSVEVVDQIVPTIDAMLVELDGVEVTGPDGEVQQLRLRSGEADVRISSLSVVGRLLHAATTPAFVYLLITVGLGMLLFEVFQPGFGVAGIAGVVTVAVGAFGLSVLPVTWWAVALVVAGLLLFALDTALAGFGPVTLAATAAFAVGSAFFYDSDVVGLPGWLVALTTLTALGFFVVVMTIVLRAQAGPLDASVDELVGRVGIVRSVLNPEGHVYVDDALWRARWTGDGKGRVGTPVRVRGTEGAVVLVEEFDPDAIRAERAAARSREQDLPGGQSGG